MPFLALKLYVLAMDAQTDGVKYRCTFQTGCKPVSPNSDGAGANMINLLLLCVLAATFEKEFKEMLSLPSLRGGKKRLIALILQYQDDTNNKVRNSSRGPVLHFSKKGNMVQNPMVFCGQKNTANQSGQHRRSEFQVRVEEAML